LTITVLSPVSALVAGSNSRTLVMRSGALGLWAARAWMAMKRSVDHFAACWRSRVCSA
jgi:hypothetical protein